MIAISKYDLKQIGLIKKKISLFYSNKLDLSDLIGDLIGFLNIIESISTSWKNDFRTEINTLEMIYDSIEDGSIFRWKGDFQEDLHRSISKLMNMTISMVDEYLKKSDPNILEIAIEVDSNWLMCPICNDAWESSSRNAMVICSKCECALHNPRASKAKGQLR